MKRMMKLGSYFFFLFLLCVSMPPTYSATNSSGSLTEFEATPCQVPKKLEQVSPDMLIQEAESGDVDAQYLLALHFDMGLHGFENDRAQSLYWYNQAARHGNACAQYNLAIFFADGDILTADNSQLMYWLNKAAENHDVDAIYNLGLAYRYGAGVSKDHSKALHFFTFAAEKGDADAMYQLGDILSKELSHEPQSQITSRKWFKVAAAKNHQKAAERIKL